MFFFVFLWVINKIDHFSTIKIKFFMVNQIEIKHNVLLRIHLDPWCFHKSKDHSIKYKYELNLFSLKYYLQHSVL